MNLPDTRPVCIMPARGGSKRVPDKNIRAFAGLPLIAHAIRAALDSGVFERVVVSTDSEKIAAIAREHGAETPFMRSVELADDFTGTAEVLIDAIHRLGIEESAFIGCLYPTAPMVETRDFVEATSLLDELEADCVLSVTPFDYPPQRGFLADPDGRLRFAMPEHELTRSQDLPEMIHDAGMFYFLRTRMLLETGRMHGGRSFGYHVERARACDIDTEEDFDLAERLFRIRQQP